MSNYEAKGKNYKEFWSFIITLLVLEEWNEIQQELTKNGLQWFSGKTNLMSE